MRNVFSLLLLMALSACSTGDLQIETIDFDSASVQFCGTATTSTQLLFKLNSQEALILELQSGLLQNEASDGALESSIPGQSQLTYRIFDGNVSTGYFCDAIPPAQPSVLEDVLAEAGTVLVTTVQDAQDTTRFTHTIDLSGVTFVNEKGERLTNLAVEAFGSITTTSN